MLSVVSEEAIVRYAGKCGVGVEHARIAASAHFAGLGHVEMRRVSVRVRRGENEGVVAEFYNASGDPFAWLTAFESTEKLWAFAGKVANIIEARHVRFWERERTARRDAATARARATFKKHMALQQAQDDEARARGSR